MMATAGDQIEAALRLIGYLGEGETPTGTVQATCLAALNQMLDSWSANGLAVYVLQDQALTWPSGYATRTLGPSGDLVGLRPVQLLPSTYYTVSGNTYPVRIISTEDYNAIPLKGVASPYPNFLEINYAVPNASITLYPTPTQNLSFHFVSVLELAQPTLYSTTLVVPPGYLRAFKFNLACELAPEVGREPPATVQRLAFSSLRIIKRANVRPEDLRMALPYPLTRRQENIISGV